MDEISASFVNPNFNVAMAAITGIHDFVNGHKSIINISLLTDCSQVVWYQIFIFSILFPYFV